MRFEFKVTHIELGADGKSLVRAINKYAKAFITPQEQRFVVEPIVLFDPGDIVELTVDPKTLDITLTHNGNDYGKVRII